MGQWVNIFLVLEPLAETKFKPDMIDMMDQKNLNVGVSTSAFADVTAPVFTVVVVPEAVVDVDGEAVLAVVVVRVPCNHR